MGANPDICPNCSERNTFHLDYCTVCGLRFSSKTVPKEAGRPSPKPRTPDGPELRKLRKKRALLTAFREGRISEEKLRKGLRGLGGGEDIERALDLKRFLEDQIKSFEGMDLSRQGDGYFPDPDEPQSDLPRDDNGAVLTDFGASAEDRDFIRKGRPFQTSPSVTGPTLFKRGSPSVPNNTPRKTERTEAVRRTVRASGIDWDEDEDEEAEWGDDESDFEIDLDDLVEEEEGPQRKKKTSRTTVEWLDEGEGAERRHARRGKGSPLNEVRIRRSGR